MASLKGPGQVRNQDGKMLRIGIVHARWNSTIVDALVAGAKTKLLASGVNDEDIRVESVPGSWELPMMCSRLTQPALYPLDAIIAIGVLIKGETMHFEYIANAVSEGLMRVQLDNKVPIIFGVLTVTEESQALSRAGLLNGSHNHGEDWGNAAVELGRTCNSRYFLH